MPYRNILGIPALILASLFATALFIRVPLLPRQQRDASQWVDHTLEVLGQLTSLEAHLAMAISEGRAFVIDNDSEVPAGFNVASGQVKEDLAKLRSMTADNPTQQQALDKLAPLVESRIALQAPTVQRVELGHTERATLVMRDRSGRPIMDKILVAINNMRGEEQRLLTLRMLVAQHVSRRTVRALAACVVLVLISGVLVTLLFWGQRRRRERARALREMNKKLSHLVDERTAELAASESRLRSYFSDLADGIVVLRAAPDGKFTYIDINAAGQRLLGKARDKLLGRCPREVWPEAHALRVETHLRESLSQNRTVCYMEVVDMPKGNRCELLVTLTPVQSRARPICEAIMCLRDVTQPNRLARQLRKSEARFRLIAEHANDMVCRAGPDGDRDYISPAAWRLFGVPPEALKGEGFWEHVHVEDRPDVQAAISRLLTGAVEQQDVTYRALHPERGEVWIEATARLLRDPQSGTPDGYVTVARDVTERYLAEAVRAAHARELERANAELEQFSRRLAQARDDAQAASLAKTRFLASVSHELRTPLTGILGYAYLLREQGDLTPSQAHRVEAMIGAAQHLIEMLNYVLSFSEIEAERVELQLSEVDPRDIASASLAQVRPTGEAKALAFSLMVAPDTPRLIVADQTRVKQVLINLLGNAVKFTAAGSVTMRLQPSANGRALRIEVVDTGSGIPDDERHLLFRDFERLNTAVPEGSGLGLASSARLVNLMGGRLGCECNPAGAGGSIFWLELPLVPVVTVVKEPGSGSEPILDVNAASETELSALRILLVDDAAMNREIAGTFLRSAGHVVITADGGAEAVEMAEAEDFDLVLMDVRMPGVDGLDATQRIRALPGPRGQVPILAFTAHAFPDQVRQCRQAGMSDVLTKPFTPKALLAAVTRCATTGRGRLGGMDVVDAALNSLDTDQSAASVNKLGPRPPTKQGELVGPVIEAKLPVVDLQQFQCMTADLTAEQVASYLLTITDRAERLLQGLRAPHQEHANAILASEAHTLAGSAGMFGFERLSVVARQFEDAVENDAADITTFSKALQAAIEITLLETNWLPIANARKVGLVA